MIIATEKIFNVAFAIMIAPLIIGLIIIIFEIIINQKFRSNKMQTIELIINNSLKRMNYYMKIYLFSTVTTVILMIIFFFFIGLPLHESIRLNKNAPYEKISQRLLIDANGKKLELIRDMPESLKSRSMFAIIFF